ncbi:unnamed protein product [Nippostrongylus brasiliensis]|uniref:Secreted protein n=1 Tax=Nippostrongylus brasiliensis TaxID=27835 RepID=A0A0N4YLL6_NIPBR|nr:hypothetical protein Q1695_000789 [Nippostrongylus brasiliensis]VDL81732.1 unnamed protein product [Nippostrongylus brasiliensis]
MSRSVVFQTVQSFISSFLETAAAPVLSVTLFLKNQVEKLIGTRLEMSVPATNVEACLRLTKCLVVEVSSPAKAMMTLIALCK